MCLDSVRVPVFSRLWIAVTLLLFLVLGCSGGGNPMSPGLRGHTESDVRSSDGPGERPFPAAALGQSGDAGYVEGEVLVVLKEPVSESSMRVVLQGKALNVGRAHRFRWGTLYVLEITDGTPVEEMVDRLRQHPRVRIAEPNGFVYLLETPYTPNDPLWESDDAGDDPRDSVYDQWGPAKLGAGIVWNETKGSDVVIAILDTGVLPNHEDLADNIWINEDEIPDNGVDDDENGWIDDWRGWDTLDEDNDPTHDWVDHGTNCAGVAGAVQDNGLGMSGVAPGIRVMAIRCFHPHYGSWEDVAQAFEYACVNGADICSMSFGGSYSAVLEAACDDAWDEGNGMILIGGSGNGDQGQEVFYPAGYDSVIAVGAMTQFNEANEPIDEQRVKRSLGYDWGSDYGSHQEVMAFGSKIVSTGGEHPAAYMDGVQDRFFGGTSCAAPMAAAVMALVSSQFPDTTLQWRRERLRETADDSHEPWFDLETGYGRCNAVRAVFGPDRYADQEDEFGFVSLSPGDEVFDTIHDVPGNPYYDPEDLYRIVSLTEGWVGSYLDIYTWGENLDLAMYSDVEMQHWVAGAYGENHWDNSIELVDLMISPGEEYFLKVKSAGPGNSTTYGLRIDAGSNEMRISGESIAPPFIHQQGDVVPFLKLTAYVSRFATLDEIIIGKSGTLPNSSWGTVRLYRDVDGGGAFDPDDELIAQKSPGGMNRMRLDGLNVHWTKDEPLVLYVTTDVFETLDERTLRLSLESYKDVTTASGIEAPYSDFPISSDAVVIGTDTDPPAWEDTVGAQAAEPYYGSVKLGWNAAIDPLTPPVKYNVYHSDTLPFDIETATPLLDVPFVEGASTDYETMIWDLATGTERCFVLRAEDQVGNEDDNLMVVGCTPISGDPANPCILASFPLSYINGIAIKDDLLLVGGGNPSIVVFNRSDRVNLERIGSMEGSMVDAIEFDGSYAYCGMTSGFAIADFTDLQNPHLIDWSPITGVMALDVDDGWAYVGGFNWELWPIDVTDPHSMVQFPKVALPEYTNPMDVLLRGDYAYLAEQSAGIVSVDCSDPAYPVVAQIFGDLRAQDLFVAGDTLFSTENAAGALAAYDLGSDPISPPLLDSIAEGPGIKGESVVVVCSRAYVARSDFGIVVFDVSDPADMQYVGQLPLPDIECMETDGTFIYVGARESSEEFFLYVIV